MNTQINTKELEEMIRRTIKFTKQVTYFGSNLVYIEALGGFDMNTIEKMERIGLKFRYLNPVVFHGKDGRTRNGVSMSFEISFLNNGVTN